ncbi:hypothetical protein ACKVEX_14790 [Rhodocyclaceae bacterium SMB388]
MKPLTPLRSVAILGLLALIGLVSAVFVLPQPVGAQPSPQPQACACSEGVNLGTANAPVMIRNCQCGSMNCVVVVSSGQLQCTR